MNFTSFTIEHISLIPSYLNEHYCLKNSDFSGVNQFAWLNNTSIYFDEEKLIITKIFNNTRIFFTPLVKNIHQLSKAIDEVYNYTLENNMQFMIYGITKELIPFIDKKYKMIPYDESSEYIYKSSDLISYPGKKFKDKRNHYNYFKKHVAYKFIPYEEKYYNEIIDFTKEWMNKKGVNDELHGIKRLLDSITDLDIFCDLILINNKVKAFSISHIFNNTGLFLYEKADSTINGLYQAICSLTAEKHFKEIEFVNRQEDLGIIELRKSKQSYNPIFMVNKFLLLK